MWTVNDTESCMMLNLFLQALDVEDVDGESVELDHEFRFLPEMEDTSRKYTGFFYFFILSRYYRDVV